MYTWDDDGSGWYGTGSYRYAAATAAKRAREAERASAVGPRTYRARSGPMESLIDPHKKVATDSTNPLVIAVDVTGSMAQWPYEIFDRLPLLYTTLSQYREDLTICFAAIGDAACDHWPLQVTDFAHGYDLEQLLAALYGEGGGGDAPESYGLFAHWVDTHVEVPNAVDKPYLIVFGDVTMHDTVPKRQLAELLGERQPRDVDAIGAWRRVTERWNVWFLRRPTGKRGDEVDRQWGQAIGAQKIIHIADEQRAVDYAMGLIARAWGRFDDFKSNMRARQPEEAVARLAKPIEMICPRCGGPIPVDAAGMFSCTYCGTTLRI